MFVSTVSSEPGIPACALSRYFCELYAGDMVGWAWKKPAVADDGCRSIFDAIAVRLNVLCRPLIYSSFKKGRYRLETRDVDRQHLLQAFDASF